MATAEPKAGGTYIYAIARGPRPARFSTLAVGNPEAPIRSLEEPSFAAIVSDFPAGAGTATRADLLAHSDVLHEVLATASAVVPLQFGTLFPDDETVRADLLATRAEELEELLDRVENRVEARLKSFYIEEAILQEIVADNPRIEALRQQTRALPDDATFYQRIELGELVAAALRRKRGEDAPALLDSLVPLAVEHVVEEEPHEWAVLAASFLIDRTTAARFDDAVAELADRQQQRMRLRYVAPLPPYSFVDIALEPAGVA